MEVNKQPSYKYNAKINSVQEQPTMVEPQNSPEYYSALSFEQEIKADADIDRWNEHICSLKSFPVHGEHKWVDGQELIEWKDFEIKGDVSKRMGILFDCRLAIPIKQPMQKEDSNDIANGMEAIELEGKLAKAIMFVMLTKYNKPVHESSEIAVSIIKEFKMLLPHIKKPASVETQRGIDRFRKSLIEMFKHPFQLL